MIKLNTHKTVGIWLLILSIFNNLLSNTEGVAVASSEAYESVIEYVVEQVYQINDFFPNNQTQKTHHKAHHNSHVSTHKYCSTSLIQPFIYDYIGRDFNTLKFEFPPAKVLLDGQFANEIASPPWVA